jgi:ubiquinone/menaquinone biosynthesis C-methylase UbiE
MRVLPWYLNEEVVKNYEFFYKGKYKNADILEKEVLKRAINYIQNTKRILEVGCGTAHFTRWLESLGYESFGLDISHIMLKEARKYWPQGELIRGDAHILPFIDRAFDTTLFVACIEYMKHPVYVLREAARISRRGIVIGLMNSWSIQTLRRRVQLFIGRNIFYKGARFYSVNEIQRILKTSFRDKKFSFLVFSTLFPFNMIKISSAPLGGFLCVAIKIE